MAASDDPLLALDNQLCFALYAAYRAVAGRYRSHLAALGLTYPQYLVMLVLWEHAREGRVTRVSDLGERLRLDSGTLTPLLKRLTAQGLIRKQRAADDERVVQVFLTDAGAALKARARQVPARLLCDLPVSPEQVARLRQQLRSLLAAMDQAVPNG